MRVSSSGFWSFFANSGRWAGKMEKREFWEGKKRSKPLPHQAFGAKKTLLKSAFFRNSRAGKTKFSKSAAKTELKISAKCKILIPSSNPLKTYLGYPVLYFLHRSHEASKWSASPSCQSSSSYPSCRSSQPRVVWSPKTPLPSPDSCCLAHSRRSSNFGNN